MLRRLQLRDFAIVPALELELGSGFTALTGETGAGKSILVDALQLALGHRGDAGLVREGAARTEVAAEFDTPRALAAWLADGGFVDDDDQAGAPSALPHDSDDARTTRTEPAPLLLRRTLDAQGKSRAWINGRAATVGQLREAGERLVDIHGQHAWQSLTRPAAVRALLDGYADVDATALDAAWQRWRGAAQRLTDARSRQADLERERERLQWQIAELGKLAPGANEWPELEAAHDRASHAQAIAQALRTALDATGGDDQAAPSAEQACARAIDALDAVVAHDAALREPLELLRSAQAQVQDAAHTLTAALRRADVEPGELQALDDRLGAWMSLARRFRRRPEELPALLADWHEQLARLDAATDLDALQAEHAQARRSLDAAAHAVSAKRKGAAPRLAAAVTAAMQQLGMVGGCLEVALEPLDEPQRFGLESAELRVAAHPGSTPRALAKVASGGELSRIALAVAVTTAKLGEAGTLIFDEIDAGIGGGVADAVGLLMRRLGRDRQVLAVTHLPQVAAAADRQCVVSKRSADGSTVSALRGVSGLEREQEIARMLGGTHAGDTSLAHARALLAAAQADGSATDAQTAPHPPAATRRRAAPASSGGAVRGPTSLDAPRRQRA